MKPSEIGIRHSYQAAYERTHGQLSSIRSAVRFTLSEPPYLSVRRSPQPLVLVMSLFIGLLVSDTRRVRLCLDCRTPTPVHRFFLKLSSTTAL
jgi:hypothetical protein